FDCIINSGKLKRKENLTSKKSRTRATPAQEREQLLQRVKDDNAEMGTMERQITEIREVIRKKQEELEHIEQ
ncbi:hypothetical protein L9F63_027623, partial [Diploptera punctata]